MLEKENIYNSWNELPHHGKNIVRRRNRKIMGVNFLLLVLEELQERLKDIIRGISKERLVLRGM